jgi:hypothetical protein
MKGNFLPLVFVPHFEKGGARGDLNLSSTRQFSSTLGFCRIRWQQTRQPLVQVKEEGDTFSVGFVALLAALAFVGFVHGGVQLLVGFEQRGRHGERVVQVGQTGWVVAGLVLCPLVQHGFCCGFYSCIGNRYAG